MVGVMLAESPSRLNTPMTSAITQGILASLTAKLKPITDERVANTPHIVTQPGLTRADMGGPEFEAAIEERRHWLREHCHGDHLIEPIRQDGRLVGRRYRFEDVNEAFWFKLRFG